MLFRCPATRPRAALLAACLAAWAVGARAAPAEQIVGAIDGMVFVCTPLDPKSVKPGQEILQRAVEQHHLDLTKIRTSALYRTAYNAEVNRLLSLPQRDRVTACQTAW
ncbi:MAG: hypothetical protein KF788_07420 [Piscinibacter sp.]|nr:hypothetical protein [Piscinibacter sp.]